MPIVEFKCARGHVTEQILTQREAADTQSVPCNKGACKSGFKIATRVEFSRPAPAQFKGAGFHGVDYSPAVNHLVEHASSEDVV